jgi:hypothetical protein
LVEQQILRNRQINSRGFLEYDDTGLLVGEVAGRAFTGTPSSATGSIARFAPGWWPFCGSGTKELRKFRSVNNTPKLENR